MILPSIDFLSKLHITTVFLNFIFYNPFFLFYNCMSNVSIRLYKERKRLYFAFISMFFVEIAATIFLLASVISISFCFLIILFGFGKKTSVENQENFHIEKNSARASYARFLFLSLSIVCFTISIKAIYSLFNFLFSPFDTRNRKNIFIFITWRPFNETKLLICKYLYTKGTVNALMQLVQLHFSSSI